MEGVNVSEPARSSLSALGAELARLDLSISPQTEAAFAHYLALVQEWNDRAGLTAIRDPEEIVTLGMAGVGAATLPAPLIERLLESPATAGAAAAFEEDARAIQ